MVPTGFRFNPTDEELIEILNQKVSGNIVMVPLDFIVETNIYELEPQDLQWTQSAGLNKNERYYYCKRENDSREVSGLGWWKATSHVKTISAANGGVMGYKRPLTFHRFRDNQRNRKDAIKTDWIMHEYGLHSIPTEWRLCKIKYKGKERLTEDMMENMSLEGEGGSSSISINPMQVENQQLQQPLPLNNENYIWSSSNMRFDDHQQQELAQPYSSFDDIPTSSMPIFTPSYDHLAQQSDSMEQPFPDLWSWEGWH
ncbi:hypothetical protein REPUB_Repub20aG0045700 [Reevesia pubescens]